MTFDNKTITCKCCGKEFEESVLTSCFIGKNKVGLDTNPHASWVFEEVIMCPHCGYATIHLNEEVSDEVKEFVKTDKFKRVLTAEDKMHAKLTAAMLIATADNDYNNASYYSLLLLWYLKASDADEALIKEAYEVTIMLFQKYLKTKDCSAEGEMIYIDLCRQHGNFKEAKRRLRSLKWYIWNRDGLKAVAKLEKKLIAEKDSSEHFIHF